MQWNPRHRRSAIALISVVALSILFHLENWWAYLAAGMYILALALTSPVGHAEHWDTEKKVWEVIGGGWFILIVVCPIMSVFFPEKPYTQLSLGANAMRMGSIITVGIAGLIVGLIVALRRKSEQPETVVSTNTKHTEPKS